MTRPTAYCRCLILLIGVTVADVPAVRAGEVVIDAEQSGWYGLMQTVNGPGYFAAKIVYYTGTRLSSGGRLEHYGSYFVFDLSGIDQEIVSGELALTQGTSTIIVRHSWPPRAAKGRRITTNYRFPPISVMSPFVRHVPPLDPAKAIGQSSDRKRQPRLPSIEEPTWTARE